MIRVALLVRICIKPGVLLQSLTIVFVQQSRYKATKFTCEQKGPLLTALYQCMAVAALQGSCLLASKLLGCVLSDSSM